MRTLTTLLLLVAMSFAGCMTDPGPTDDEVIDSPIIHLDDACGLGICPPVDAEMEEVDLQEHTTPLYAFLQEEVINVLDMVRVDTGWAFIVNHADSRRSVVLIDALDGSAMQYVLPSGHTSNEGCLLLSEGHLFVTSWLNGERSGVTLHDWTIATGEVERRDLDLPTPASPVGSWDDQVLLIAKKGLLDGNSAAWVFDGNDLITIGADGRVSDAAMVMGLLYVVIEDKGMWSVQMQSVEGDFTYHLWPSDANSSDATIGGIWGNDGHVAFNSITDTSDPSGGRLWEINHVNHSSTRLGNGWDVRFVGDQEVHYLTAAEGSNPFMAEWSRSLGSYSEGHFLPDGALWDVSGDGVWWLEQPRTDHRFDEAPNPTPYTIMLMESAR